MTQKLTLGVMDSGVGGLTILKELVHKMPNCNYLYLGDTANLPYGSKSKDEILFFNKNILNFFVEKGVNDVVIACNTTSALTYEDLKKEFEPKGLKIFPLIQSIVKSAIEGLNDGDCICVLSTLATANSKKYSSEIHKLNPNIKVVEIPCSGFVEIVENRKYDTPEAYKLVEEKMQIVLENKAKRVILGCTHYPYLICLLEKFAPREIFFNPSCALADEVSSRLECDTTKGKIDFYVTKDPLEFKQSAKLFFDIQDEVKCIKMPKFSQV